MNSGLYDTLEVRHLEVDFATFGGTVQAVRDVSFGLNQGECLALVGESGCGKTVTAHSIIRIIPRPPGRVRGEIYYQGRNLMKLREKEMQKIRGAEICTIFQDPMTYLNPTMKVGVQITEIIREHSTYRESRSALKKCCIEFFERVGMSDPERRFKQYPHEFSGGMRQRVLIAMALINKPRLVIADEPTTALDVTIQAQMLEMMKTLQRETRTAFILITHDLGVVAKMAHRVAVVYAGKIVESASANELYKKPAHPYTVGLLNSIPGVKATTGQALYSIPGTPPDLFRPPAGCGFAPRCPQAMEICDQEPPPEFSLGPGHFSACWLLHHQAPANPLRNGFRVRERVDA